MTSRRSGTLEIVFVLAVAENGVIGNNNEIPWRLKADMQRFRALTMDKPVVMGRKTFLSLKRPLPGRTNIVMTRDPNFSAPGAVVTKSLAAACWERREEYGGWILLLVPMSINMSAP